ncbi:4-(cytidine 5'-diphospho)-2-C-methyl-D-erythritol kinase [Rhizobium sp. FKY42]|uniref:4-(cytidine 5'-diphospho)-2-C-methyl-D-erythritol kinase n=1 Tax=Rhizobium sp. FKY42 TaxID=2562310 RepID=UPI0010C0682F|nr:4-(cytidine 5'-diphospho)-2-C-methyl-D-erythritol kinase [Rhizobium sp. FKY42]
MVIEAARAKINLALHVTGQRADGYHLLDSLVTFADFGDELAIRPSAQDRFEITGRFADTLSIEADNLVTRARDGLRALAAELEYETCPVDITLTKSLPLSSGIGGGSADAAATLRGLARLWNLNVQRDRLAKLCLSLGADVPMCLASSPLIARGIGEDIEPLATLPPFFILLINPLKPVSTPQIFRLLTSKSNAPLPPFDPAQSDWLEYLGALRNDLQEPAQRLLPEIGECLRQLEESGAEVSRMSGSGATCFGLYRDEMALERAALTLQQTRPQWYVRAGRTLEGNAP